MKPPDTRRQSYLQVFRSLPKYCTLYLLLINNKWVAAVRCSQLVVIGDTQHRKPTVQRCGEPTHAACPKSENSERITSHFTSLILPCFLPLEDSFLHDGGVCTRKKRITRVVRLSDLFYSPKLLNEYINYYKPWHQQTRVTHFSGYWCSLYSLGLLPYLLLFFS